MLTIFSDALMQGSYKILVAPSADATFFVGRDVRRIERTKGQLESAATRKRFPRRRCVAGDAIGGSRQILAARHRIGSGEKGRYASRVWPMIISQLDTCAAGKLGGIARMQHQPARCHRRDHDHDSERHKLHRASHEERSWSLTGNLRIRTPVAAKIALVRAGAAPTVPTSPIPPGASLLLIRCTSTIGASSMRSTR